jgi:dihydrofolate reductase
MSKVRVHNFSISLDGYAAAPNQSLEHPFGEHRFGEGDPPLHDWMFATRTGRKMMGQEGGEEGLDDDFAARGDMGIGATIMGRNMFGPIRGPWGDAVWKGWWGDDPPYHHPVFVLTHYPHDPIEMQGGTTFNFVTDGIEAALERATDAAGGKDVRIGGGASTIQQYLRAGLIDEMHVVVAPILLGDGERLFENVGAAVEGYEIVEFVGSPTASVAHAMLSRLKS